MKAAVLFTFALVAASPVAAQTTEATSPAASPSGAGSSAGAAGAPPRRQAPAGSARAASERAAHCEQALRDPAAHTASEVESCRADGEADARFNQLEEANRRVLRSICPQCLD